MARRKLLRLLAQADHTLVPYVVYGRPWRLSRNFPGRFCQVGHSAIHRPRIEDPIWTSDHVSGADRGLTPRGAELCDSLLGRRAMQETGSQRTGGPLPAPGPV
jgi:hypothetical protein